MTDWVTCPICGESDMRREKEDDGYLISCVNINCGSNGGDNFAGMPKKEGDGNSLIFCLNHNCPSNKD